MCIDYENEDDEKELEHGKKRKGMVKKFSMEDIQEEHNMVKEASLIMPPP